MRIDIGGTVIDYGIYGANEGPWVTFCHSLAASREMWTPQIDCLAATHRILAYDLPGHGRSPASRRNRLTPLALVHDAIGLIDALDIGQTHFVGLSLGGMIGIGVALHFPQRLHSLVACNCRADVPARNAAAWRDRIALVRAQGIASIVEPTFSRWFSEGFATRWPACAQYVRAMIAGTGADGYASCAEALMQVDYRRRLQEIAVPALFLAGSEDAAAPAVEMHAMCAAVTGACYAELSAAGHLSNLDNVEGFNRELKKFLESVDRDAGNAVDPADTSLQEQ